MVVIYWQKVVRDMKISMTLMRMRNNRKMMSNAECTMELITLKSHIMMKMMIFLKIGNHDDDHGPDKWWFYHKMVLFLTTMFYSKI